MNFIPLTVKRSIHHREDESFYVIDGKFSILLSDCTTDAGPSSFCRVPKGTLHTYQNVGTGPGKALVILTPAGFEKFWMEIGKPVAGLTGPSGPPDPETIAKLMSLALKYGLEMKGSLLPPATAPRALPSGSAST